MWLLESDRNMGTSLPVQWLRLQASNARGVGSIPGQGATIPCAQHPKNWNIKQKQHCDKFNKDFKNGPHKYVNIVYTEQKS